MFRRNLATTGIGALALLVTGCATPPLVKPGVSQAVQRSDEAACWKWVLSKEGQERADLIRGGRVLIGGLGMAVLAIAQAQGDPKQEDANKLVYTECMGAKGYDYQK